MARPPPGWVTAVAFPCEVHFVPVPCTGTSDKVKLFKLDGLEPMRHVFIRFSGIQNSHYIGINQLKLIGLRGEDIPYSILAADGDTGEKREKAQNYKGWWAVTGQEHSWLLQLEAETRITHVGMYCANTGATPKELHISDAVNEGSVDMANSWSAKWAFDLVVDARTLEGKVQHAGKVLNLEEAAEALNSGDITCARETGFRTFLSASGCEAYVLHKRSAAAQARLHFGRDFEIPAARAQHLRVPKAKSITEEPERRAMTLAELRALRAAIVTRCVVERWQDCRTKAELLPEEVNLYNLNFHHICPLTVPQGVVLKGLDPPSRGCAHVWRKSFAYTAGQEVSQGETDAKGVVEEVVSSDCIRVVVHQGRFQPLKMTLVDGKERGAPAEITQIGSCSYKELISAIATVALWFCSHWWGESVLDFVACCEEHAACRGLTEAEASYWVCGYANRQHDLGGDLSKDPADSSFNKAMLAAVGILLILDRDAVPFTRIWCDFEIAMTRCREDKMMDVVTCHEGRCRLLTEGSLPDEVPEDKTTREKRFPLQLLASGLSTQLELGDASMEIDKVRILNSLSKNSNDLDNVDILKSVMDGCQRQCFKSVNSDLNGAFAVAAWPQAIQQGSVTDFDSLHPGCVSLPKVLAAALNRKTLELSFAGVPGVTDEQLCHLASGLPRSLQVLKLRFSGCLSITDRGVGFLAEQIKLLSHLQILELSFFGIVALTGASLHVLAESLPWSLQELLLDFTNSLGGEGTFDPEGAEITDSALQALLHALPLGLEKLSLFIGLCKTVSSTGYRIIATGFPSNLRVLELDLTGGRDLSKKGPDANGLDVCDVGCFTDEEALHFIRRLPASLRRLRLDVGRHRAMSRRFADAFAQWMSTAQALEELQMDFYMAYGGMHPIGKDGMQAMWSCLPRTLTDLRLSSVGRDRETAACIARHLPSHLKHLRIIADKEYVQPAEMLALLPSEDGTLAACEDTSGNGSLPLQLRRLPREHLKDLGDAVEVLKKAGLSSVHDVEALHGALAVVMQAGFSNLPSVQGLGETLEANLQ